MQKTTASDVMVQQVISVYPETPLLEAARIISEHNFDGVPVVDRENRLVGILTEYDLISRGTSVHLPTLQKVLQNLSVDNGKLLKEEIKQISDLCVRDAMNAEPLTITEDAPIDAVVKAFHDHHRVNPIPVINQERRVVGVISRCDIVKLFHLLL